MRNPKNWVWLLLFGSLWGISEVIGGEAFYRNNVPHASVWLSAWAFLVLALGRGLVNKPGSSTAIGGIAALYKLVYAAPYFCHLLGILILGLTFDVLASVLIKEGRKKSFWPALSGALSAYTGYALFALVITYVVRYDPWVTGAGLKSAIISSLAAAMQHRRLFLPFLWAIGLVLTDGLWPSAARAGRMPARS